MEKVLVAMSGGVDSAVAALRLVKQGYKVQGVTLALIKDASAEEQRRAAEICRQLGIEHTVLHLEDEFTRLVQNPFAAAYWAGQTPNPCVICNKTVKFGLLMEYAQKNGFDRLATGHYADIAEINGKRYIKKAADVTKDQTYVLWQLSSDTVQKVMFPLGGYLKTENREEAAIHGFTNAHTSDSQDICFIKDGDYAGFIERFSDKKASPGNYIDVDGNPLGKHKGVIRYTVGQRKGLNIALGKPAFVIAKNADENTVTLGDEAGLFCSTVYLSQVNSSYFEEIPNEVQVAAKLRYSQKEYAALFIKGENGGGVLRFLQPQRAPAPGQSAVFYIDGILAGGGIIEKGE